MININEQIKRNQELMEAIRHGILIERENGEKFGLLRESIEQPDNLTEVLDPNKISNILDENDGKLILTFQLQRADELNANNRIYPKRVLETQLDKYQKLIEGNASGGELDHPDNAVVSLANVSHRVVEAWWDQSNIMGRLQVGSTWAGQQSRALLEDGFTLGISSRAIGSTKRSGDGYDVVQEDLQLIAWDLVSSPSTPGSWQIDEALKRSLNATEIIPESINNNDKFLSSLKKYLNR